MNYFGNNLRKLRLEKGLTQKELAIKLGVSSSTVNGWERKNSQPDFNTIEKICLIFNVKSDELIFNTPGEDNTYQKLVKVPNVKKGKYLFVANIIIGIWCFITCLMALIGKEWAEMLALISGLTSTLCFIILFIKQLISPKNKISLGSEKTLIYENKTDKKFLFKRVLFYEVLSLVLLIISVVTIDSEIDVESGADFTTFIFFLGLVILSSITVYFSCKKIADKRVNQALYITNVIYLFIDMIYIIFVSLTLLFNDYQISTMIFCFLAILSHLVIQLILSLFIIDEYAKTEIFIKSKNGYKEKLDL